MKRKTGEFCRKSMRSLIVLGFLLLARIAVAATVDHFEYSPVASPQHAGVSYNVVISARDSSNALVTDFTDSVAISAASGAGLQSSSLLGNITYQAFSFLQNGSVSAGFAFTPRTNLLVTHVRHFSGGRVSIWRDDGVLLAAREIADFGGTWTETPLYTPVTLLAGTTYRVTLWSGAIRYYWRNDTVTNFAYGLIGPSYSASSDVFPTSVIASRTWLVDLRYSVGDSDAMTVSPITSSSFIGGLSTNSVTIFNPASNVRLLATDGSGHLGASAPFTVLASDDITLDIAVSANPCPQGDPLLYSLIVSNTGPTAATQVTVSNLIVGPMRFVSGSPSQGSYSVAGNTVVFNAGTLAGGSAATFNLWMIVTNTGIAVLQSTLSRGEPDGSYENNSKYAVASLVGRPSLTASDVSVTEANTNSVLATLNFNLSLPTAQTVLVNYATSPGSASAGTDFLTNSGTLVFPPGTTNLQVGFTVLGDFIVESNEFFYVNLTNAIGVTLARSQIKITINDNEPTPTLTITDVAVPEGDTGTTTNAIFNVRLNSTNLSERVVSVAYATANGTATAGSDYTSRSGSLTFAPGITNQTISVPVIGDVLGEPNETFVVNLSSAVNAFILDPQGVGTISNDDPLSIGIDDVTISEGNNTNYASFRVWISPSTNASVVVTYSTADGTAIAGQHYAPTNGTIVFPAGTTNQTLQVGLFGDTAYDVGKTFFVNLTNPVGGILYDSQALCTITNNDSAPQFSVVNAAVPEGDDGNTNLTFQVVLSGATKVDAAIRFATADVTATAGKDYLATNGLLNFPVGTTNLTVGVPVLGDRFVETNETFALNLSSPTNATVGAQGVGTIINDDGLPGKFHHLEWAPIASPQVAGSEFTVTLSARDISNVLVTNFAGPVLISALTNSDTATLFLEDFEDGILDGWSPNFVNTYQNITNQTAALGTNSFYLGTFFSVSRSIFNLTPSRINFSVRTGATNAFTGRLSVGNGAGTAAFFTFANNGQMGLFGETSGAYVVPYQANQWYKISLLFNWNNRSIDYLVNDTVAVTNIPFRSLNVSNITQLTLDGYAGASWWDQIEFIGTTMVPTFGILTPESTSQFTNGVWTGDVVLSQAGSKVMLVATNNDGSVAGSNPFRVNLPDDLIVSLAPDRTNGYQGDAITYLITAYNTGPDPLTAVILTNVLPSTLSFNSATASQGTWSRAGQTVTWLAGTIPPQTTGTLAATVISTAVGWLTNTVTGVSDPADNYASNNTSSVHTFVSSPLHHFNISSVVATQQTLMPFAVTITARDLNNKVVSNFNDSVWLSASRMFKDDFEDGNLDGWEPSSTYDSQVIVTNDLGGVNNQALKLIGTPGITHHFPDVSPAEMRFKVRIASPSGNILCTIGSGPNEDQRIVHFRFDTASMYIYYAGGNGVVTLPTLTDHWYEVRFAFNWPARTFNWYVDSNLIVANIPFYGPLAKNLFQVDIYNWFGATSWWDDIELRSGASDAVAVTPGATGAFTNGTWTGLVTVDEPVTNLQIRATNSSGYIGLSPTFTVVPGPHGVFDHLAWDFVSAQLVNQPFPATVRAVDSFGVVVSNYSVVVGLQAKQQKDVRMLVFGAYADSNQVATTLNTIRVSFTNFSATITTNLVAAVLQQELRDKDVFLYPFQMNAPGGSQAALGSDWAGLLNEFVNRGGVVIVCASDGQADQVLNKSGLLACSTSGSGGVFTLTKGTNHILTDNVTTPFLAAATMYYFFNTNGTVVLKQSGGEPLVLARDVGLGHVVLIGANMLYSGTRLDLVFANAVKWARPNGLQTLAVTPATATISNGVGNALVTISNLASPVYLMTDEGFLNSTFSNPFQVGVANDVCITSALSNGIPVVGLPLLVQVGFTNVGPNAATGVRITNELPAGSVLISADSTVGTCSNLGSRVVCDIGTLTSGAGGQLNLTLLAGSVGPITNQAVISRDEADYYPANNSTTLIAQVLPPPSFSVLGSSLVEPDTGTSNAVFEVRLFPPSGQTSSVTYATADVTAMAGLDYLPTNGVLTFTPGQTNKFLTVAVKGDLISEDTEYFNVVLTNPTNALLGTAVAAVTILDNSDPLPVLLVDPASQVEGDTGTSMMTFTAHFSGPSGRTVSAQWSTAGGLAASGTDFDPSSGVLTFAPGQTNTTFQVPIRGDYANEPDEFFFVNLAGVSNAVLAYTQTSGVIRNDDARPGYLDHFNLSVPLTPAVANQPFWVSIEARDALNFPLTSVNENFTFAAQTGRPSNTVEVLTWTGLVSSGRYPQILTAISNRFTDFHESTTTTTDPSLLNMLLQNKDVLLIPPQNAPSGYMGTLGAGWSNVLNQFVASGGVLIVCSDNYDEHLLLSRSGFLQLQRLGNDPSGLVISNAPSSLLTGVSNSFSGPFVSTYNASNGVVVLKTVANNYAVVIQRAMGKGAAFMIGSGFFSPGSQMDQVLANAVRWNRGSGTRSVSIITNAPLVLTGGAWLGQAMVATAETGVRLRAFDSAGTAGVAPDFDILGDRDGDGLPDSWELANNLDPDNPDDAANDMDGDAMSNLAEFRAGTNPGDPASALRISATPVGDLLMLQFFGAAGRLYVIEWTDSPAGAWSPLAGPVTGSGDYVQQYTTITRADSSRLFRVKLLP